MGSKPISFKGNKCRGLGLTHAYKVINAWAGKISIESEIGIGTSVRIELKKSSAHIDIYKQHSSDSTKIQKFKSGTRVANLN